MARGEFTITINRRNENPASQRRVDKATNMDNLRFVCYSNNGYEGFMVYSLKVGYEPFFIPRHEVYFVKVIYNLYGAGDYSIKVWGKGKGKVKKDSYSKEQKTGLRRFWDGIIAPDGSFFRRKEASMMIDPDTVSMFSKQSWATNTESYISRYMKTVRPGIWYGGDL